MLITPEMFEAIYDLKENYSVKMDNAGDGEEYEKAYAAYMAVVEVLSILGD